MATVQAHPLARYCVRMQRLLQPRRQVEGHDHWSGQIADQGLCLPECVLLPPGLGHVPKTINSSGWGRLVTAWPTRLLCPWESPGKNTGVGCHFLLQRCPLRRQQSQGSGVLGRAWRKHLFSKADQGFRHQDKGEFGDPSLRPLCQLGRRPRHDLPAPRKQHTDARQMSDQGAPRSRQKSSHSCQRSPRNAKGTVWAPSEQQAPKACGGGGGCL